MELELKYKVKEFPFELIETLGFVKSKESRQIDWYYIVNDNEIFDKRTYLRSRINVLEKSFSFDFHQIIECKEDKKRVGTEETEPKLFSLDDIYENEKLWGKAFYWFSFKCEVDKHRIVYKKDNIKIMLDMLDYLGKFVEIEIKGKNNQENRDILDKKAEKLGLKEENRVDKKGYPDLIKEKNITTGRKTREEIIKILNE